MLHVATIAGPCETQSLANDWRENQRHTHTHTSEKNIAPLAKIFWGHGGVIFQIMLGSLLNIFWAAFKGGLGNFAPQQQSKNH